METWFVPRLPVPPSAGDTRRVTRVVAASLRLHRRRRCLSFVRCLAGELTSRYRMRLRMGLRLRLRMGLGRVFNDGAEHIKQVDNVIPSTSAKGTQFQEL